MTKKLFITGTGTDVGKTYVTGLIVKKLLEAGKNPAYFKAAMSGNKRDDDGKLIPGDSLTVKNLSGTTQSLQSMCPYIYEHAISPHLASRIEGNPVDISVVEKCFNRICEKYSYVAMEGSGGILCPLRFDKTKIMLEDIIRALKLSNIIVADAGLGTINNVVLTADYMRQKKLPLKGIILNNFHKDSVMEQDNKLMCEQLTGLKVLACVSNGDKDIDIEPEILCSLFQD